MQLRGIGLGGWLLPEGYMWGIRDLDRPRQFEAAIVNLIGDRNALKFWHLYHKNFLTRSDVLDMKSWGINTLRIPILASMLQPREGQPAQAPFHYDEKAFTYLDDLVAWCEELGMGVIWDLHGAPGGQNAENISDSDGQARLWTERAKYWPLTLDLWDKITQRYASNKCIVGYDLLNEPLLSRYPDIDPRMLRELYVLLTELIRRTDTEGIIFIEGDDWAQDFSLLEPLDWDPHLVVAFHSYPPTSSQRGIQRWDNLRQKYNIPIWHGETGEQDPPWEVYKKSTTFLEQANVGWNWWTHKKFELSRQPWSIPRTEGFDKILDYWKGKGPRPSKRQAKSWLFDQARRTNTNYCDFYPEMVASLRPLDPTEHIRHMGTIHPEIRVQPGDLKVQEGFGAILQVSARGYPLNYQWFRNGLPVTGANDFQLFIHALPEQDRAGDYQVIVSNEEGFVRSDIAQVTVLPFGGIVCPETEIAPFIDGEMDSIWESIEQIELNRQIGGHSSSDLDLGGWFAFTWNAEQLFFLVRVVDDILSDRASIDYMKDGIEIYLDIGNQKTTLYGENQFQIRSVLGKAETSVDIGTPITGIQTGQKRLEDGYFIEMSIPWEAVKMIPEAGQLLGLDVHINDNDGSTRQGKLAWWSERDNAYQTPAVFGVIKLERLSE